MNTYRVGLELELRMLRILESSTTQTIQMGGPNDRGIDLQGRLNLKTSPLYLCQCKNSALKLSTKYLRELEGTLSNYPHQTVGIMATSGDWTRNSKLLFHYSKFPLVGMQIDLKESFVKSAVMNLEFQRVFPNVAVSNQSPYFIESSLSPE